MGKTTEALKSAVQATSANVTKIQAYCDAVVKEADAVELVLNNTSAKLDERETGLDMREETIDRDLIVQETKLAAREVSITNRERHVEELITSARRERDIAREALTPFNDHVKALKRELAEANGKIRKLKNDLADALKTDAAVPVEKAT